MIHSRQFIREQAVTDLTGLTETGSNVFKSRVYPLKSASLPGLCVYTIEEDSEPQAMGGRSIRSLEFAIDIHVQGKEGEIDDALDAVAVEVEAALENDRKFDDFALNSYLQSTEIEYNKEGKKPVGVMKMRYIVEYSSRGFLLTQDEDFLTNQLGNRIYI